jgi:hypothetical protein
MGLTPQALKPFPPFGMCVLNIATATIKHHDVCGSFRGTIPRRASVFSRSASTYSKDCLAFF